MNDELTDEELQVDIHRFRCVTCGHDMFFHFRATGHCQEVACECSRFVSAEQSAT